MTIKGKGTSFAGREYAPTAAAVWAERTCEVAGDAAQNSRAVLWAFFFAALECQICAALAKAQPAEPSLRMSSAFHNAGGAVEDTQGSPGVFAPPLPQWGDWI